MPVVVLEIASTGDDGCSVIDAGTYQNSYAQFSSNNKMHFRWVVPADTFLPGTTINDAWITGIVEDAGFGTRTNAATSWQTVLNPASAAWSNAYNIDGASAPTSLTTASVSITRDYNVDGAALSLDDTAFKASLVTQIQSLIDLPAWPSDGSGVVAMIATRTNSTVGRILDISDIGAGEYPARLHVDYTAPVTNNAPVAGAGADRTLSLSGATVSYTADDATGTDADVGDTLTYAWTVVSATGGGTTGDVSFDDDTLLQPEITFDAAGVYTLRLTVSDGTASDTDDVVITVSPAPNAALVVQDDLGADIGGTTVTDFDGNDSETITLDASASTPGGLVSGSSGIDPATITNLNQIYEYRGRHIGNIYDPGQSTTEATILDDHYSLKTPENVGKLRYIINNAAIFDTSTWNFSPLLTFIAQDGSKRLHAAAWRLDADDEPYFTGFNWANAKNDSRLTSGGAWYNDTVLPERIRPSVRGAAFTNGDAMEAWIYKYIYEIGRQVGGDITSWDVVNEPVKYIAGSDNDITGTSTFFEVMSTYGDQTYHDDREYYCKVAIEAARAALADHHPGHDCKLVINEYNTEESEDKFGHLLDILRYCADAGFPPDGIGFQMHANSGQVSGGRYAHIDSLTNHINEFLTMYATEADFSSITDPVVVCTELDVRRVDSSNNWLNGGEAASAAAQLIVYEDIVGVFSSFAECTEITMWCVADSHTWLDSLYGTNSNPGLFDDSGNIKQSLYDAVLAAAKAGVNVYNFTGGGSATITDYHFEVSANAGSSWSTVYQGSNATTTYAAAAPGSYQFRVTITNSETIEDTSSTIALTVADPADVATQEYVVEAAGNDGSSLEEDLSFETIEAVIAGAADTVTRKRPIFRLPSIAIPQGVTIQDAKLHLWYKSGREGIPGLPDEDPETWHRDGQIYAVGRDADDAAALGDATSYYNWNASEVTTALSPAVDFLPQSGWVDGQEIVLNVTSVLQELFDRAGWVSGNAVVFVIEPLSNAKGRFYVFEDVDSGDYGTASDYRATLTISTPVAEYTTTTETITVTEPAMSGAKAGTLAADTISVTEPGMSGAKAGVLAAETLTITEPDLVAAKGYTTTTETVTVTEPATSASKQATVGVDTVPITEPGLSGGKAGVLASETVTILEPAFSVAYTRFITLPAETITIDEPALSVGKAGVLPSETVTVIEYGNVLQEQLSVDVDRLLVLEPIESTLALEPVANVLALERV